MRDWAKGFRQEGRVRAIRSIVRGTHLQPLGPQQFSLHPEYISRVSGNYLQRRTLVTLPLQRVLFREILLVPRTLRLGRPDANRVDDVAIIFSTRQPVGLTPSRV